MISNNNDRIEDLDDAEKQGANVTTPIDRIPNKHMEAVRSAVAAPDMFRRITGNDSVHYALPTMPSLNAQEKHTVDAVQYATLFRKINRLLPPEHITSQECRTLLNEICAAAGISPNQISLYIFEADYADVHIIPDAREMHISLSALESIEYRPDLLKAIMAHEIGHVLLRHFPHLGDDLDEHISSYDEEYQADRVSSILMARLGENPEAIAEALEKIEKFNSERNYRENGEFSLPWLMHSHPDVSRRTLSTRNTSRLFRHSKANMAQANKLQEVSHKDFDSECIDRERFRVADIVNVVKYGLCGLVIFDEMPVSERAHCFEALQKTFALKEGDGGAVADIHKARVSVRQLQSDHSSISEFPCLEASAGQVNKWAAEHDTEKIREWWVSALHTPLDSEYYADFKRQLKKYTSATAEILLQELDGVAYIENLARIQDDLLGGELSYFPVTVPFIVEILMRKMLEGFDKNPESIERFFLFLSEYRKKHGSKLPDNLYIPFLNFIRTVFLENNDFATRKNIIELLKKYIHEFNISIFSNHQLFVTNYFHEVTEWGRANTVLGPDEEVIQFRKRSDTKDTAGEIEKFKIEDEIANTKEGSYGERYCKIYIVADPAYQGYEIHANSPGLFTLTIGPHFSEADFDSLIEEIDKTYHLWNLDYKTEGKTLREWIKNDADSIRDLKMDKTRFGAKGTIIFVRSFFEKTQKLAKTAQMPASEYKRLLCGIPYNFQVKNKRQYLEGGRNAYLEADHDRFREADSKVAAVLMSDEEFKTAYFGKGRTDYVKVRYGIVDDNIALYRNINTLWRLSTLKNEFDALAAPHEKIEYLANTHRARNAYRDQLFVMAMGWSPLEYVDDIPSIQNQIKTCSDRTILLQLMHHFSNSLLSLSCSERLWQFCVTETPESFLEQLSSTERARVLEPLAEIEPELHSPALQAIVACYPGTSYVRDEKLRPLIDAAVDESSTLQIASLLSEPPPGVIQPRRASVVVIQESLFDAMKKMDQLSKEECLLYMLGHRNFYSAIDALSDSERREKFDRLRAMALYKTDDFKKKEHGKKLYKVSEPDAIVNLVKIAGVPLDHIFDQHRVGSTKREQRDLLAFILCGETGVLVKKDTDEFLSVVAHTIVYERGIGIELDESEKRHISGLLTCALKNCALNKLPDLFLECLYLSQTNATSLPELIATLMQKIGPVFVKAGQYLATQTATLPKEWIKAFGRLSDGNAQSEKTLLYEYEYAAYGIESPFESMGRKINEGSMAAVYEGTLKSGEQVAVKVVHPFIESELDGEIKLLQSLVEYVNDTPSLGLKIPSNLAEVINAQMSEELSTEKEIEKNTKLASALSPQVEGVRFSPMKIYTDHCREGMIVMGYCPGKSIAQSESSVRNVVGIEVLRQILAEDHYQSDPNPGNFREDQHLVYWLDPGNVQPSTPELKGVIKEIAQSLLAQNMTGLAAALAKMIKTPTAMEFEPPHSAISRWISSLDSVNKTEGVFENIEKILQDFIALCENNGYVLNEFAVHLLKTLGLLRPLLQGVSTEILYRNIVPLLV